MSLSRMFNLEFWRLLLRPPVYQDGQSLATSAGPLWSFERFHFVVLSLRSYPVFRSLFSAYYKIGERVFLVLCLQANRKMGKAVVRSIYLRRGGGRSELILGASDLDFFLVLEELSAAEEMVFLKEFWSRFRAWKKYFPFLGETLMGDANELANWAATPTVRSFEAAYSWRLLWGRDELARVSVCRAPLLRDVFSESAKAYWAILQPVMHESLELRRNHPEVLRFRNAAKATLDLFRMHYSFGSRQERTPIEIDRLWSAPRAEIADLLPAGAYGGRLQELKPLLLLEGELPNSAALYDLFSGVIYQAFLCLDEIAVKLNEAAASEPGGFTSFRPLACGEKVISSGNRLGKDHYSLSVREVFAERIILRNKEYVRRTLVSGETSHMIFPFHQIPSAEVFRGILDDLRMASSSFHRASVAIPLSELAAVELERSSFLDSPFHAFHEHQETILGEDGKVRSSPYSAKSHFLPNNILQKTFAETSLAIRFQPPPDFIYLVENLIRLVLELRVADEFGEIATDFYSALGRYSERHALRANYLKDQVGKYLNLCNQEEDRFWDEINKGLDVLGERHPHRANLLRAQIESLKNRKYDADWKLQRAATDLWIEITPFLRLELNSMRDRYLPIRSTLKI